MKIAEILNEVSRRDFLKGAGVAAVGGIISPPSKAEARWVKYDTTFHYLRIDKETGFRNGKRFVSPEEAGPLATVTEFSYDANSLHKLPNGNYNIWIMNYQFPKEPPRNPFAFRALSHVLYEVNPQEYSVKDKWWIVWSSDEKNNKKLDWIERINEKGENKWTIRGPNDPLWKVIKNIESSR